MYHEVGACDIKVGRVMLRVLPNNPRGCELTFLGSCFIIAWFGGPRPQHETSSCGRASLNDTGNAATVSIEMEMFLRSVRLRVSLPTGIARAVSKAHKFVF
jgi:hypothetical protein